MRLPAWAAAWWQRRREAARPAHGRIRAQLVGGPRDGQPYDLPRHYPGADALPDTIATHDHGRVQLYDRQGRTFRYRYREEPPAR